MSPLNFRYAFSFRQSPEDPKSWRERFAWLLRKLADRIDRKESLALKFVSEPELARDYRNACVEQGMRVALDLMIESVKYESMDRELEAVFPHLWKESETNSSKS